MHEPMRMDAAKIGLACLLLAACDRTEPSGSGELAQAEAPAPVEAAPVDARDLVAIELDPDSSLAEMLKSTLRDAELDDGV